MQRASQALAMSKDKQEGCGGGMVSENYKRKCWKAPKQVREVMGKQWEVVGIRKATGDGPPLCRLSVCLYAEYWHTTG